MLLSLCNVLKEVLLICALLTLVISTSSLPAFSADFCGFSEDLFYGDGFFSGETKGLDWTVVSWSFAGGSLANIESLGLIYEDPIADNRN